MDKPADLEDRLVDFAVRIINVVEAPPELFKSLSCYFTNDQSSAPSQVVRLDVDTFYGDSSRP